MSESKVDSSLISFYCLLPWEQKEQSSKPFGFRLRVAVFKSLQHLGMKDANDTTFGQVSMKTRSCDAPGCLRVLIAGPRIQAEKLSAFLKSKSISVESAADDPANKFKVLIGPIRLNVSADEFNSVLQRKFPGCYGQLLVDKQTQVRRGSAIVFGPTNMLGAVSEWDYFDDADRWAGKPLTIRKWQPPAEKYCKRCFGEEHVTSGCKLPWKCGKCLKEGHFLDDCPNPTAAPCSFCKSTGHFSFYCPKTRWPLVNVKSSKAQRIPSLAADFPAQHGSSARPAALSAAGSWPQVPSAMEKRLDDISRRLSALEEKKAAPADGVSAILSAITKLSDQFQRLEARLSAADHDAFSMRECLTAWSSEMRSAVPALPLFELKDVPRPPLPTRAPVSPVVHSMPLSASAALVSVSGVSVSASVSGTTSHSVSPASTSSVAAPSALSASVASDVEPPMTITQRVALDQQNAAAQVPVTTEETTIEFNAPTTPTHASTQQSTQPSPEKAPAGKRIKSASGQVHTHVESPLPTRDAHQRKRREREDSEMKTDDSDDTTATQPSEPATQLQTTRTSSALAQQPQSAGFGRSLFSFARFRS